jgi:hypothetical protein
MKRRPITSDATLKCIICKHTETKPLPKEMPVCPKCYGPMILERIEATP